MSAKPAKAPKAKAQLSTGTLVDASPQVVSRLLSEVGDRVGQIDRTATTRTTLPTSLAVGTNRLAHGLGRRALGANVVPSVADATFAWAFANVDDRTIAITVVGVAQPHCAVEVW